ncbi:MAG: hypothetical protein H0T92_00640 [Pyrinomonadaceae bacterium]|nr:hypothetical protein [Pyrinomonadaceae bacterium]
MSATPARPVVEHPSSLVKKRVMEAELTTYRVYFRNGGNITIKAYGFEVNAAGGRIDFFTTAVAVPDGEIYISRDEVVAVVPEALEIKQPWAIPVSSDS